MPALKATDFAAEVVWLGSVADREAGLTSQPLNWLDCGLDGPQGETHGGATRPSCSRVAHIYPRGTEIRNVRQMSILSEEELQAVAERMGLDRVDPAWLGVTVLVRGLPEFTHVPPSSRLVVKDGVSLTVDMENRPCQLPAQVIEGLKPGHGKAFKEAAKGRRGVTAWVERAGRLSLGDRLQLYIPDQPVWNHIEAARA